MGVARRTFEEWFGGEVPSHIEMRLGEVEDAISEVRPERVVLDVPEPWTVIEAVGEDLPGGAVFTAYIPTVLQIQATVNALRSSGVFSDVSAFEVLHREWHVQGRSVRPTHEMVAHTGFIVTGRRYHRLPELDEEPGDAAEEE
jgi:tRNA (adenine57-N1/adenine58-N1)-methyltransferase